MLSDFAEFLISQAMESERRAAYYKSQRKSSQHQYHRGQAEAYREAARLYELNHTNKEAT